MTSWLPNMFHGNTSYLLSEISCSRFGVNGPVSQSCTVAKREEFWRATGQSNLVYKWLTTTHLALFLIYCLADAIEKMGIHGWRSATSAQRRFSSRYSGCLSICFPTLFCLSEIVERDSCWMNKRKKATGRVEVLEIWVHLKCLISGARATYV